MSIPEHLMQIPLFYYLIQCNIFHLSNVQFLAHTFKFCLNSAYVNFYSTFFYQLEEFWSFWPTQFFCFCLIMKGQRSLKLTVWGCNSHRYVDKVSSFGPFAADSRAGVCVSLPVWQNVPVDQSVPCKTTKTNKKNVHVLIFLPSLCPKCHIWVKRVLLMPVLTREMVWVTSAETSESKKRKQEVRNRNFMYDSQI